MTLLSAPPRTDPTTAGPAPLAPAARLLPALAAVYRAQLARARVARIPLLFVATFQSVGILVMMRGVVDAGQSTAARSVVAGSSVLVVAFVALNLLAQYFGKLRATGGLDHYATLPVPPASVVLGTAAAYASFTLPGAVLTAALGAVMFGLPLGQLWVLLAVVPLAGAALSGLGAACGLLAPRQEIATMLGQLGMSAALLLGVLPVDHLPSVSYTHLETGAVAAGPAAVHVRGGGLRADVRAGPGLDDGARRPGGLRGGGRGLADRGHLGVPAGGRAVGAVRAVGPLPGRS